jgi:dolichol-phosphate mannosyltransferase
MLSTRADARSSAPANAGAPVLSIVVPAFDEAGVVGPTLQRMAAVAEATPELSERVEVVVVSDGSRDGTFDEARRALGPTLPGTVVELAANAGSHAAIRCGLRYAHGEHVAIMAADGQDPPELLPAMLRRSADVVWGRRADRAADRSRVRWLAAAYYRVFRLLTGLDYPPGGLDFVMVRRPVVRAVLDRAGRNTSLFLLIYNLGFAQSFVDYRRGARAGGTSGWTHRKRVGLAVDMMIGVAAAPVRVATLSGLAFAVLVAVAGAATMLVAALAGESVPAWAAVLTAVAAMNVPLLAAVAFLGEYAWRILDELRGGPPFVEARSEHVLPEDAA